MMEFRKVPQKDLPVLLSWLSNHLPESWTTYGTLREELRGKWAGTTYYTLGWPDIKAVAEGPVDKEKSRVWNYFTNPLRIGFYAPEPEDARTLLTWPGFIDWTKPIVFQGVAESLISVLQEVSGDRGGVSPEIFDFRMMKAEPGDFSPKPVPNDLRIERLKPERDAPFIQSTWQYASKTDDSYPKELIRCFPSVGIFDRQGNCVGVELGTELAFIGMLYVAPEARGRGLGKILTSHLAQDYFKDNLPVVAFVSEDNGASVAVHEQLGFKKYGTFFWFVHHFQTDGLKSRAGL